MTDTQNTTNSRIEADRSRDLPADLSTGWRGVYAALEVDLSIEPDPDEPPPKRAGRERDRYARGEVAGFSPRSRKRGVVMIGSRPVSLPLSKGWLYYPTVRTATERHAPGETGSGGTLSGSLGSGKSVPPSESDATSRSNVSGDVGAQAPTTHMSTSTPTDETAGSTRDDRENDLVTDGGRIEPIDAPGGNAPGPETGETSLETGARAVELCPVDRRYRGFGGEHDTITPAETPPVIGGGGSC